MRKSLWVGMALAALLAGCASKGVYESDAVVTETFTVNTNYEAAFRRAGEYVRTCHVQVQHAYNVAYAWRHVKGEKGAPDEVQLYKVSEPAKVLELISAESASPSTSKVTVTVLGEGRWDAAEIAAAKTSIQSATPVCRKGGEG
ncbi:BPTD_2524 family lipoprotein [Achromobacter insolitus]|uniref:BPTD_2524 family lipoprotein n=1 Tax=Achromobacter insolitus TaxID=217204 RepID=UPI0007C375E3|nr:hypothetical protein [Achromobacter insolitus]OAD13614.1 hypothetical protein A3839_13065 [Achromobacter insolitus]